MIIICGNSIAEVERDLEAAKAALATGAPMAVGGATMADVEQALLGLRNAVGGNAPIDNPNYDAENIEPWYEDEDEDECDGNCCECGCTHCDCECYEPCEDEDEVEDEKPTFIEWLNEIGAPAVIIRMAQDLGLE